MSILAPPTLTGFISWAQSVMGITTTIMTEDDPGWNYYFTFANYAVSQQLSVVDPDIYTIAIYNWGGSLLLQFQQDYEGQVFFTEARTAYGINAFYAGPISDSSDESTNATYAVGMGLSNLDATSLQRIKDPYGRTAIALSQQIGTLWGLT
jgi:hypothetical protein